MCILWPTSESNKTVKYTSLQYLANSTNTSVPEIGTASANSAKSDHGCSSRIYLDNASDNVTLTLFNVTLTSQKPCLHNNKCDCSKTNGLNEVDVFSLKYLIEKI